MKKWTTTKMLAAGSLGVMLLVLTLVGTGINAVTGVTHYGGSLNSIMYSAVAIISLMLIKRFGSATITFAIFGILAIPLPILFTTGFLPKVLIAITGGLIADVIYFFLKKRPLLASLLIGGPILYFFSLMLFLIAPILDLPAKEVATKFIFSPIAIGGSLIIGALGGYLGLIVFRKVENTALVKRIQHKG